jgi:mannan endo-1,4-beta-mannosidase
MKKSFLFVFLIGFLLLTGCSSLFISEKPNFVKVNGTQFELAGHPYYFAGTNLWYGGYLGSPGQTGNRARLIRELDNLKSLGITNLRLCAASEQSLMGRSVSPAIQISPGVYDENLLKGLDFLLAELNKRDMHAVLFVNNYWQWTGGMAQYNGWFGDGKVPDPDNPAQGYGLFMDYSAQFYNNDKAKEQFRKYLSDIINRKNTITDKFYYEDPAIMAWQLANEPRPGNNDKYLQQYYSWIAETAQYIHSIDPNHLVTTGSEGLAGCLQSEEIFLKSHQSKYIDYATMHLWPKNWGWFNAFKANETYPATEKNAIEYIAKHLTYARQLNKPITMEEFGIPRDSEKCKTGTPTTVRDKYFTAIFKVVEDSASSGAPLAGTNFWGWGGEGRSINADNVWHVGDPYTNDPAQEPQGLNSVFDTDSSTLDILKTHSLKMEKLREKKLITEKNTAASVVN